MKKRVFLQVVAVTVVVAMLLAQPVAPAEASFAGKGKPPTPAQWTFMVYIVGDNNLDPSVIPDIETELAPAGSNKDVSVVVLADRAEAADWSQTLLFYVEPGMSAIPENAVEDWDEANMGDPETLIRFIEWTKAHYPAEHYALSLWNHGWSWRPGSSMRDDTDDDSLDQHELEAALEAVGPIDVIMYDACQMASIENEATVREHAQAIVHSEEYVNWDGIEYEVVIPALHANPSMTAEELAIVINQSAATNHERTGSAVALDERWDALIGAVDEWSVALEEGLVDHRADYVRAFRLAQSFWGDRTAKDLYDLAYNIKARVNNEAIQATSQAVMDAVDAVVIDEWHTQPYHGAHGISIFLPAAAGDLQDWDYYRNVLRFSELTDWDEFLDAFVYGE
jgi:hypothetical protein